MKQKIKACKLIVKGAILNINVVSEVMISFIVFKMNDLKRL